MALLSVRRSTVTTPLPRWGYTCNIGKVAGHVGTASNPNTITQQMRPRYHAGAATRLEFTLNNATTPVAVPEPDRYIRLPELKLLTGFKSTPAIYQLMARGEFPNAVKIGRRAVAWKLSDVRGYLASRPVVVHVGTSYAPGYAAGRRGGSNE